MSPDVLVVGGGNAALCAALAAREGGARVLLVEWAPREWRGGNTPHTRNLRCMHEGPQDVLTGTYSEDEYWEDLHKVTAGATSETLARLVIRESAYCRTWMRRHGAHFQPALSGTLHLHRTNAFFLGGGKALLNAYYRSAQGLAVDIRYRAAVDRLDISGGDFVAAHIGGERIAAGACVIASGGFESNREWLRAAWGRKDGEWIADNFVIRGTRFNTGVPLERLIDAGADTVGDATQCHAVAVDARSPLYDGGICTRIDCVPFGIVVNRHARRFDDEGRDFWPKRYAVWGRLVAQQPGQIAYSIIDAKAAGRFMPPVFPGERANSLRELAQALRLDADALVRTVNEYNAACVPGSFDHTVLDDCTTSGIAPPKTHWAQPIDTSPFVAYPLRPGITFTYLGVKVNHDAAVCFSGRASGNLFAAGEAMAGNVLGEGYVAGVGMTIGTVFGRIAGANAAAAARREQPRAAP